MGGYCFRQKFDHLNLYFEIFQCAQKRNTIASGLGEKRKRIVYMWKEQIECPLYCHFETEKNSLPFNKFALNNSVLVQKHPQVIRIHFEELRVKSSSTIYNEHTCIVFIKTFSGF